MARRLASRMGMAWGLASRVGVAWRLASLGMGAALGLWLRTGLAVLVDPVGFPPLRVGLRRASGT